MEITQKEVTLGGRIFVGTSTDDMTFDQFAWIQSAVDRAGLGHELVGKIKPVVQRALDEEVPLTEDEANDLTQAIVSRCYRERAHLDVLAGLLVEKGKPWTYDGAVENKEFLGRMKGAEDIELANILLAQAIMGFFWSGLDSMMTSQNFSGLAEVVAKLREDESGQEAGSAISGS